MDRSIRKKISFSNKSLKEIEKIRNEKRLRNDSEVIDFLLEEYLENKEKELEDSKIYKRLGRMDYEMMLTQYILRELAPDILGVTDTSDVFIKSEQKLKKRLRF